MYKLYKYSFIIVGTLPVKTSFEIVNKAGKMIFATLIIYFVGEPNLLYLLYWFFFLQLCVLKGCFQYNDAKPTDDTPYKPGQPGAEWSSDEIDIVRERVGKARFFLETNF